MTTAPHLIAVYRDHGSVDRLRDRVEGLTVDAPRDQRASLQAEMREELEHSLIAPQAGMLLTKEMTKGALVMTPIGALIGALLALPFSAMAIDDWAWWQRALLVCVLGAVAGGTVGTIVGAAISARGPDDASAAHEGITVRADHVRPEVVRALVEERPIRLDLVDGDGLPLETLLTEEEYDTDGIMQRLEHQLTQPSGGDWHRVQAEEVARLRDDLQGR